MPDPIVLRKYRNDVDNEFVGFPPNGSSIKPVHIAGGSLRTIYGKCNTTMSIKKLALVSDAKGVTQPGNTLEEVMSFLQDEDAIEDTVSDESLESMRNVMQKLLSADKGVYVVKGLKDGMISYTAGSKYFLTKHAMYEDAGEFIGGVLKEYCPDLVSLIKDTLDEAKDPVSILFSPVLSDDAMEVFESSRHDNLPAFKNPNAAVKWYIQSLKESAKCLKQNLENHPNPLTKLRIFNFYCIFQIIRYMSMLETFYCGENIRPILLDFTGASPSQSSVARASEMSYTQLHKALNRFYAWAYAQKLDGLSKEELLASDTPVYEQNAKMSKASKEELDALWSMAKERASLCDNASDIRVIFGETMYDILALEASSHPVNYLKALGTASGILYPPDKQHPNKRFSISQDILEMLLRSCVLPDEVLNGKELRERLWERFGVVIGGTSFEMGKIQKSGMILQVDEDALEANFLSFAAELEAMDFAEIMADGILQIRFGGKN